jgi:hypothetical protein
MSNWKYLDRDILFKTIEALKDPSFLRVNGNVDKGDFNSIVNRFYSVRDGGGSDSEFFVALMYLFEATGFSTDIDIPIDIRPLLPLFKENAEEFEKIGIFYNKKPRKGIKYPIVIVDGISMNFTETETVLALNGATIITKGFNTVNGLDNSKIICSGNTRFISREGVSITADDLSLGYIRNSKQSKIVIGGQAVVSIESDNINHGKRISMTLQDHAIGFLCNDFQVIVKDNATIEYRKGNETIDARDSSVISLPSQCSIDARDWSTVYVMDKHLLEKNKIIYEDTVNLKIGETLLGWKYNTTRSGFYRVELHGNIPYPQMDYERDRDMDDFEWSQRYF